MSLYTRFAGSQFGSSAMFGGALFAATLPSEGLAEALVAGSVAAASWLATLPVLKRLIAGIAGA